MPRSYSLYNAKARFSEVLRQVREGRTITITYRGEAVAEVRPVPKTALPLEERLRELANRGVLAGAGKPGRKLRAVARRRGALKRFLAERD